jgi:hypothetical protein
MRRWLAVLVLVPLLSGCTGQPNETGQPPTAAPTTGTPSPGSNQPEPTTPPPSPTSPETGTTVPPTPGRTTPPPDDRRGDLVKGRRTLTGTISRDGTCIVLVVADRRWSLTGKPAERLTDGEKVRVTGTLATVHPGCPADHALAVTQIRPA